MLYYHKDLETIADVKEFFKWLLDEEINFHPEDDFKNYINFETKEPSFSHIDQAWSIKSLSSLTTSGEKLGLYVKSLDLIVVGSLVK